MLRRSTTQFRSALRRLFSDSLKNKWRGLAPDERKRATTRVAAIALVVIFGFGTGWIAGEALSGALRHSSPEVEYPTPAEAQPEPDALDFQSPSPALETQRVADMGIVVLSHREKSAKGFGWRVLKSILKGVRHHNHHGNHRE